MSLIPGLGSLGPIGKLLDPGALVKDVVNGVLPKNMAVVGDLAGAVVDFKMGNPIGAVQHAMEAVHDLPQAAKGLQQGAAAGGTDSTRTPLDPSPPPLGSRAGKPFDMNELMSAIKALTAALTAHQTSGLNAVPKELREKMAAGSNAAASSTPAQTGTPASTPGSSGNSTAAPAAATATNTPTAANASQRDDQATATATSGEGSHRRRDPISTWVGEPRTPVPGASGWGGEPRTAAPATSTQPSPATTSSSSSATAPAAANAPAATASAPAAAATPSSTATPPAGSSTGQTISSISQLQGMSDRAVRDAVLNGRIAPEVAKDQTAMMAIQQRMNAISEMNNLMTAMMRAVHDMQMAIIQNIRI